MLMLFSDLDSCSGRSIHACLMCALRLQGEPGPALSVLDVAAEKVRCGRFTGTSAQLHHKLAKKQACIRVQLHCRYIRGLLPLVALVCDHRELALPPQGRGWELGHVRQVLQGLIDKHAEVSKAPPFVYKGPLVARAAAAVLKAWQDSSAASAARTPHNWRAPPPAGFLNAEGMRRIEDEGWQPVP